LLLALAVSHRGAAIKDEMADQIGLHCILFDDISAAVEINSPVDVLGIIAPNIPAVADKLDSKPRESRPMRTSQVAQD